MGGKWFFLSEVECGCRVVFMIFFIVVVGMVWRELYLFGLLCEEWVGGIVRFELVWEDVVKIFICGFGDFVGSISLGG